MQDQRNVHQLDVNCISPSLSGPVCIRPKQARLDAVIR